MSLYGSCTASIVSQPTIDKHSCKRPIIIQLCQSMSSGPKPNQSHTQIAYEFRQPIQTDAAVLERVKCPLLDAIIGHTFSWELMYTDFHWFLGSVFFFFWKHLRELGFKIACKSMKFLLLIPLIKVKCDANWLVDNAVRNKNQIVDFWWKPTDGCIIIISWLEQLYLHTKGK